MKNLVFLEPNKIDAIPFTTSKIISEVTGIRHDKIKAAITKHQLALETFGLLTPYGGESTGGHPEVLWQLNEQQATLLVTFLKNTPVVVEFKTELVRQFYLMRTEWQKRHMRRLELKPIRREMTDIIQEVEGSKRAYKKYTDLAYKTVLGKNAAQIRKERHAPRTAAAVDYLTSDEIGQVTRLHMQIGVLLDMGMNYEQVKAILLNKKMIGKIA